MRVLQIVEKIRVDGENQAQSLIDEAKTKQPEENYLLKKASYEYKVKKSKGEVVDDCYIVTLQKEFGGVWDDE